MALLIETEGLSREFHLTKGLLQSLRVEEGKVIKGDKVVRTVNEVGFQIEEGEVFGLVGKGGCGESITARIIICLLESSRGWVLYKGKSISYLSPRELLPCRKGMQMIFQNPYASLNPRQEVENIIMEPMLFHGVVKGKSNAKEQRMDILSRVGLRPEQAGRYPHQFSGDQRQHIGTTRALAAEPEFTIADESVSALDAPIQTQILNPLMDLKDEFHSSCLFIARDLSVVRHISDRLSVMYLDVLVEMGNKQTLFQNPLRPCTEVLFSTVPTAGEKSLVKHIDATGEIPSPVNLPKRCFFCECCLYATEWRHREHPELREIELRHQTACHIL